MFETNWKGKGQINCNHESFESTGSGGDDTPPH